MPVILTYDLTDYDDNEHTRIRTAFERLGWERAGGSALRYPRLGTGDQPVEDWFNHIVPALMLFRAFMLAGKATLTRFQLEAHSSAGHEPTTNFGNVPATSGGMVFYDPQHPNFFGHANLCQWLDGIAYPY